MTVARNVFAWQVRDALGMKMYSTLAAWWPLLSPPDEYEEEAGLYLDALGRTGGLLLELGAGGGNNAFWMKRHFASCTLTDVSPEMLEISRKLHPELEHVEGDMRTLRLSRTFDCVFTHDAICYMATADDLLAAMRTAFAHLRPGGVTLFCPDHTRETFEDGGTDCGGADSPDGRGMRYLEWCWDADPDDTEYRVEYTCVLRAADGSVEVVHDRHVEGLFERTEWLRLLGEAGFAECELIEVSHSEVRDPLPLFRGVRPAG